MRKNLTRVLALALVLLFFSWAGASQTKFNEIKLGAEAQDFTLTDWTQNEREYTLSGFKGEKIVVLQFGSSTSWPYVAQITPMENLAKKYRRKGVQFFIVYTREATGDWQAKNYFEKIQRAKGLRFAFGVTTHGRMNKVKVLIDKMDDSVFKAYGMEHNAVFVIDKDGNIVYKARNPEPSKIESALKKLQ